MKAYKLWIAALAVAFVALVIPMVASAQSNLLQNGDFDIGADTAPTVKPWAGPGRILVKLTSGGEFFGTALGLRGVCGERGGCGRGRATQRLIKPGDTKAGDPGYAGRCFRISFKKVDLDEAGFGYMRLEAQKAGAYSRRVFLNIGATQALSVNANVRRDDTFLVEVPEDPQWLHYSIDLKIPAEKERLKIDLKQAAPIPGMTTIFDDVFVTPIKCSTPGIRTDVFSGAGAGGTGSFALD